MAGHVAGVVLAAGLSRRFTHGNKLLALVGGEFVVRRTVLAYCQALAETIVVVGYQAAEVRSALGRLDITVVDAADYKSGQSASLRSEGAATRSLFRASYSPSYRLCKGIAAEDRWWTVTGLRRSTLRRRGSASTSTDSRIWTCWERV